MHATQGIARTSGGKQSALPIGEVRALPAQAWAGLVKLRRVLPRTFGVTVVVASLSGCAFSTALTLVAAAPALEPVLPAPRPLPDGYETTVRGETVMVEPTRRRFCPSFAELPEQQTGLHCARIVFRPTINTTIDEALLIAKEVAAENPHMTWAAGSDEAIRSRNNFANNDLGNGAGDHVSPSFKFLYSSPLFVSDTFSLHQQNR